MPEGDTIYRTAETLRRVLLGKRLTGFVTSVPQVEAVAARRPVVGRVVADVVARGKHLLVLLRDPEAGPADDLVLHTHMRMTGAWHVYHPGVPWRKPARFAKVVLRTEDLDAPCFSAPIVELLTFRETARHPALTRLGPDAIAEDFDEDEAVRRLGLQADLEIGEGLLRQQLLAGVGTVFKSEILFLERVDPFARIGDLGEDTLRRLVVQARRLLLLNRRPGARRTRSTLDPEGRIWVYRRSGRACYVCGGPIGMRRQGAGARSTYFCPGCQGVSANAALRAPDRGAGLR
jgi:endonuclease-8